MESSEHLEELARAAEQLAEQLADAAMEVLRAGLEDGGDGAAVAAGKRERVITRARTSLEKASRLLREAAS